MSDLPHIPCIRLGKDYRSLDESQVCGYRDGKSYATLSQVNAGIVRRDLAKIDQARAALKAFKIFFLL